MKTLMIRLMTVFTKKGIYRPCTAAEIAAMNLELEACGIDAE